MTYNFKKSPIKVFGVPNFYKTKKTERLPDELDEMLINKGLGKRCPGGRVCFRTDAPSFTVKVTLATNRTDAGMSIYAAQSLAVLIGDRKDPYFAGLGSPMNYDTLVFEKTVKKHSSEQKMDDVTIFFPRNEGVLDIEIEVDDRYTVEAPTPYLDIKPIVYYGSSITEGGCSALSINAYNAIISNHLNLDYFNLGFSGSARAELPLADYIADNFDMSIFVYDYDHNAPDVDFLKATHEPFFLRLREKCPTLPVIMMSRPLAVYPKNDARRATIKATYDNAVARGDKNVYFIDGESYFLGEDAYRCLIDTIHPNDYGFTLMARRIEPVIKNILGIN